MQRQENLSALSFEGLLHNLFTRQGVHGKGVLASFGKLIDQTSVGKGNMCRSSLNGLNGCYLRIVAHHDIQGNLFFGSILIPGGNDNLGCSYRILFLNETCIVMNEQILL